MTRERIRQIEKHSLKKLQRLPEAQQLRSEVQIVPVAPPDPRPRTLDRRTDRSAVYAPGVFAGSRSLQLDRAKPNAQRHRGRTVTGTNSAHLGARAAGLVAEGDGILRPIPTLGEA